MSQSAISTSTSRYRIRDIVALTAIVVLAVTLATIWKESSETDKRVRFQIGATEIRIRQLWQDMLYEFGAVPDQGAIYDAKFSGVGIIVEESFDGYTHNRSCRFQMPVADNPAALEAAMEFVIPRLFRHHQWKAALEKAIDEATELQEQSASTKDGIQRQFEINDISVELSVESVDHRRGITISLSDVGPAVPTFR